MLGAEAFCSSQRKTELSQNQYILDSSVLSSKVKSSAKILLSIISVPLIRRWGACEILRLRTFKAGRSTLERKIQRTKRNNQHCPTLFLSFTDALRILPDEDARLLVNELESTAGGYDDITVSGSSLYLIHSRGHDCSVGTIREGKLGKLDEGKDCSLHT